jgi:protease-4
VLRRLFRNTGVVLRDAVVAPLVARVPRDWILIRLERGLIDMPALPGWTEAFRPSPRSLSGLLTLLERAGRDARVQGVVLRVGRAPLGWSKLETLSRALAQLRAAGKLTVVYAERTGNAGAWLGAQADHFFMTPEGSLDLLGVRVDSPFLREALDRLQIHPDVIQAGRFKGAGEIVERAAMSDDAREALDAVVDDLYAALVGALASGAAGTEEQARTWIDDGPYQAAEARSLGLVDELLYGDELRERLARLRPGSSAKGDADVARLISDRNYQRVSRPRFALDSLARGRKRLAVVPVEGLIRLESVRPIVNLLGRLRKADEVRGVVLRVNSPGGDPLASDLLWRAVGKLRERKPVVASMGDTAASGGYYAAMAANEIVAEATTLTGSIGVIMIGLEFEELLASLGVNFDGVGRGRHAGIYDPYHKRTDEERSVLTRHVDSLYRVFVAKAAEGRGRDVEELERVAQGRVWSGAQAAEVGLVDHVGGLELAFERVRALAGLATAEGVPEYLSPQPSLLARLRAGDASGAAPELPALFSPQLLCPIEIPLR